MRKFAVLSLAVVGLMLPATASALVGVAVGVKGGQASYSGDVLPGSGDVGSGAAYGAVLEITTLPLVDLEFHANYFAKTFTYEFTVGGVPASSDIDFRDFNLEAVAKRTVFGVVAFPLKLYLGAGVGWHLLSTEVAKDVLAGQVDPAEADDPVALFKNHSKMAVHGLVGLRLSVPALPLGAFGEVRYGRIFTDSGLSLFQVEGGVLLEF
jgi:hypothetical protein